MSNLKIEYLPVGDLKPYTRNARKHETKDIKAIKASIEEFGFDDPIGIWKDNIIIEGHGRLLAAKELGMTEVPCIRLDHLTDEQRRAYALAHNRTAELSEWDFDVQAAELAEISNIDMSEFGFDINDISSDEVVEDDYEESPPTEPISKLGDIYQLGEHRLMCGDATKRTDIDMLILENKIDLALTDPPYGIAIVTGGSVGGSKPATFKGTIGASVVCKVNEYSPIIGDETTDSARSNYELIKNISKNQIIFGGNYFTDFLSPSSCWIVWDKKNGENNFADVELAWTSFDRHARLYSWMWNGMAREGDRSSEGIKRIHPTQKPVGLLVNILKEFSNIGDTIIDCFGGSGSTLIACEHLGRKCLMMELDPHYVDVIIDRWETFTGDKAVKL